MEQLKIAFANFYPGYDIKNNILDHIVNATKRRWDTVITDADDEPDILFFSCFDRGGINHLKCKARIRIYITGENDVPDFNIADSAISFHHIDFGGRHLRLPIYCLVDSFYDDILQGKYYCTPQEPASREFCSAVISNITSGDSRRLDIFNAINKYRDIASGGRWHNNVGGPVSEKWDFLPDYKFHLALENSSMPGYITEKIVDAFYCRTVPIYWGAPDVALDFNPRSFININDFNSLNEAVRYIERVDNDDELYMSYLEQSPLDGSPFTKRDDMLVQFIADSLKRANSTGNRFGAQLGRYNDSSLALEINRHPFIKKIINKTLG
ncbi:MAG: hypothetical protein J6C44_02980 [Muribaculaceae bacterium]|nr:hypothetical protein [Muribaculaceae bacterium]